MVLWFVTMSGEWGLIVSREFVLEFGVGEMGWGMWEGGMWKWD